MRIEEDMKLDFKDVLFRPKRSTLRSRSEVDLNRTFTFRNSKKTWTGVPIMAANMDTVGRFEVFDVLKQFHMFTCIQKHYTKEEWNAFNARCRAEDYNYLAITSGTSDKDSEYAKKIPPFSLFVLTWPTGILSILSNMCAKSAKISPI